MAQHRMAIRSMPPPNGKDLGRDSSGRDVLAVVEEDDETGKGLDDKIPKCRDRPKLSTRPHPG